ncbi:MAG: N-acetylmuramoyl-L-alanine amidase [Marinifilaceae bacterium]
MKTVCIDAGHGGRVPGAITKRVYEKTIVLDVALRLGKLIESKHKDIKVVYTRKTDIDVGLYERAEIANKANADLFISIHANSTTNKRVYGTETFVFGLNKTDANLKVAMKENDVIKYEKDYKTKYQGFNPSRPESYIMFNMVQNHHREQSIEFAEYVEQSFKKSGRRSRGVQESSLIVLITTAMPAVLVELGFISNLKEERFLMSKKGKKKIANNLFNAFEKYKNKVEKKNNIVDATQGKSKDIPQKTPKKIVSKPSLNTTSVHFGIQIASKLSKMKITKYNKYGGVKELFSHGRYRYYVKVDGGYQVALKLQSELRKIKKDCFLIAVSNGNRISVVKARKLINK